MKDIYVFDMGGVITRSYCLRGLYNEMRAKIPYTEFKYYVYCSKDADDAYRGIITRDTFFKNMAEYCKVNYSPEELIKLYYLYKGALYKYTLFIMDYLKSRGNKVCLLSNLHEADYNYLQKNMDMSVFDKQFLSYEMHKLKPEPGIYEEVINELGTNDFYFFDDSGRNISAAKDFGIKAYKTTGHDIGETFKLIKNNSKM